MSGILAKLKAQRQAVIARCAADAIVVRHTSASLS